MQKNKVSSTNNNCLNIPAGIGFIESSALNASNVETAFTRLITKIYNSLHSGKYDDRLEHFNFFGSEKIRSKALESQQQSYEDS